MKIVLVALIFRHAAVVNATRLHICFPQKHRGLPRVWVWLWAFCRPILWPRLCMLQTIFQSSGSKAAKCSCD